MSRSDLSPGLQAAQAVHAAFLFAVEHPAVTGAWHSGSNYLILLSVPDEASLLEWAARAQVADVESSLVREPDIGDQATALAVGPHAFTKALSVLPLHGREVAMV